MTESELVENLVAVGVVMIVVLVAIAWWSGLFAREPPPAETRYIVAIDDDPMLGDPNAPVTVIEFSDFLCPACKDFHDRIFPQLKAEYIDTGRARFVFRDFPIEELHPDSPKIAEAAECADDQGKFWEFHDAIYRNQARISEPILNETVAELGMDLEAFHRCRKERRNADEVEHDMLDGRNDGGVTGTPTFFIGGRRIVGSGSIAEFRELIEAAE